MRKIQWRVVVPWSLLFVAVAVLPAVADLVWEGQLAGPAQVIAGVDESGNVKRLVLGSDGGIVANIDGPVDVSGSSVSLASIGTAASESTLLAAATRLGAVDESAASTDTASSGLNGRLQRLAQHLTRLWQGPQASCAHYRGTTTSVSAGSSGTSIDAGATGTVYWLAASNLSRTYDIQISADTGTFRVPPSGSVTLSNPGAATADSITVATNCTGCGGAATNVTVLACDDD